MVLGKAGAQEIDAASGLNLLVSCLPQLSTQYRGSCGGSLRETKEMREQEGDLRGLRCLFCLVWIERKSGHL